MNTLPHILAHIAAANRPRSHGAVLAGEIARLRAENAATVAYYVGRELADLRERNALMEENTEYRKAGDAMHRAAWEWMVRAMKAEEAVALVKGSDRSSTKETSDV